MIDKLDYWRSIELGTYIHGRLLERYSAYHIFKQARLLEGSRAGNTYDMQTRLFEGTRAGINMIN